MFNDISMKWDLPVRVDSESNMLEVEVLEHLDTVQGRKDVLKVGFQIPSNLLPRTTSQLMESNKG